VQIQAMLYTIDHYISEELLAQADLDSEGEGQPRPD